MTPTADIRRASATDLAFLAMDSGPVPQQIGAVLMLAPGPDFDLAQAMRLLADRLATIPRIRQRLVRLPVGCGPAIWVDAADFDATTHIRELPCREPGDEQAFLDVVREVVTDPLPRSRPLWSAAFLTGLADHRVAVLVVMHHVLLDGIGGMAVLADLVDGARPAHTVSPPSRPPSMRQLAADNLRTRLRALSRLPSGWRRLSAGMTAGGGIAPSRAQPCSLVHPTGRHRRFAVVATDLARLRAAAHHHGGTVNDAVLSAVAGALRNLLSDRGESVDTLAIAVPVAGRRAATTSELGNQVGPMLITVRCADVPAQRISHIAAAVRTRKQAAAGPPPIAVVGALFRFAARLGGYHWYMNHQHRLHTLVSTVRGPEHAVFFGGTPVVAIIPIAVGEAGNVTVSFTVLSYADTLTITAIVDPDHFPDLPKLVEALRQELALLTLEGG